MEKIVIENSTLYHADCREIVSELSGIGAVVTDPPYGMAFQSGYRLEKHAKIANDECSDMLKFAHNIEADHSSYIFCRWDNLRDFPEPPSSLVAWIKPNWSMGDLDHEHGRQYELIAFYPGPDHQWPYKRPSDVVRHARTGNSLHPTEKPVSLMQEIVSWTHGLVFDPFMGSGTTGIGCADLSREFIGCEVERKYFDIACDRIEAKYAQRRLFT